MYLIETIDDIVRGNIFLWLLKKSPALRNMVAIELISSGAARILAGDIGVRGSLFRRYRQRLMDELATVIGSP